MEQVRENMEVKFTQLEEKLEAQEEQRRLRDAKRDAVLDLILAKLQ